MARERRTILLKKTLVHNLLALEKHLQRRSHEPPGSMIICQTSTVRQYFDRNGQVQWRCRYCSTQYLLSGGSHIITNHITKTHGLEKESTRDRQVKNQQRAIEEAFKEAAFRPHKRRKLYERAKGDALDGNILKILRVSVLVACSLAFRLICLPQFRAFLQHINPDILAWLPTSTNTIKIWVLRQFKGWKETIKKQIGSAKSKVHISCDLWSSPNSLVILGIIAHYIDEDGKLQHSTLALPSAVGDHTGEHLCEVLMAVLKDWGLGEKLGFFMMDNAPNNDVMMRALQRGKTVLFSSWKNG